MPSRAIVRTGLASTAVLALALLTGSPALADDLPLQVGDACTADTVLPAELICLNDVVAPAPVPADTPAADPAPTDPPATDPTPTEPPASPGQADPSPMADVPTPPVDVPPILGGDGSIVPPVNGTGDGTGSITGTGTGGTGATPLGPTAPDTPTAGGSSTTPTEPGTSLHASATTLDPATTTKSMLTAATVSNLASGDLPSLAAMRSLTATPGYAGLPLSAYTPSPDLADLPVATALSSVQAPLLAVGDDAANGGGFTLAGLSSRALPGLLVVLATALVATVGAGNLRYWQDRFGTRR